MTAFYEAVLATRAAAAGGGGEMTHWTHRVDHNPYRQVTWFPDGKSPANGILVMRTSTAAPGGYYVRKHPNVVWRFGYALRRSLHSIYRRWEYGRIRSGAVKSKPC